MNFEKVQEHAKQAGDVLNQPKVGVPVTGFFAILGNLSPEQWLTYLSICAVVGQLIISSPKIYQVVKGWVICIGDAIKKALKWLKQQ